MSEWVCVYCIIVPFLFFRPLFVSFHSPPSRCCWILSPSSASGSRAMTSSKASNRASDDFFKSQQQSDELFKSQQQSDELFKSHQQRERESALSNGGG